MERFAFHGIGKELLVVGQGMITEVAVVAPEFAHLYVECRIVETECDNRQHQPSTVELYPPLEGAAKGEPNAAPTSSPSS